MKVRGLGEREAPVPYERFKTAKSILSILALRLDSMGKFC